MIQAFDKFLLIGCICVVISLVLYFFYWNRLIAFLLGLFFRFLYWNQGPFSVWLEIGSIHFSILTGRILIKDFRYHSSNQTIKIVRGSIEWRWWIRRPASGDDIAPMPAMNDCMAARSFYPSDLTGFEWFLYNRTASFDAIVTQMGAKLPSRPASRNTGHQSPQRSTVPGYSTSVFAGSLRLPVAFQRAWHWVRLQLPTLDPKDLLPLGIEVTKGAIICGNPSTPNLLVAEFRSTEGMFGLVQSRSKYDLYKQLLHLTFQQAIVRYVQNEHYRGPMVATGELLKTPIKKYSKLDQIFGSLSHQGFAKLWRHLKLYAATRKFPSNQDFANHSAPPRSHRAHGKHKSFDDDTPIGADFATFEYAIDRKILEAPVLELTYYTEVVGDVPSLPHPVETDRETLGMVTLGRNGELILLSEEGFCGMDLGQIDNAPSFRKPSFLLLTKIWKKHLLRDDTTLYIPFREASKNWQWDGHTNVQRRPKKREPASIHVTVGDRSSINYMVPMVATAEGYESVVEVHLDTVEITSSLNDIRLVSAESCRIRGELPSPLQWNARRTWKIGISLRQAVLYLLRDHINMFTDLGKDWAAGPPSDYHRFVPTVYAIELELHHYELNLYVNDHNIIDKPLIRDENALLTARGTRLKNISEIPSDIFRPESTTISFSVDIPDVSINLSLPRWNTWALHAPKDGNSIAKARVLKLDGFFRYFSEVRDDTVEQLKLTITARDLAYKGLGWSVRYFMILQTNYFGSFTTFSTLFEYLEKRKRGLQGDPVLQQYRKGQSNKLQVDLDVDVQNSLMVIPTGLAGYEGPVRDHNAGIGSCVLLDIPELQVHFRLHDFFMELSLNIGTVTGCIKADFPERMTYAKLKRRPKEIVIIDGMLFRFHVFKANTHFAGIDITSNRLFGPLPRTMAYVCIWEIGLGAVKAVLSAKDATILSSAGRTFGLNFEDISNAPAATYLVPVPPDVTYLKFSLAALDVTWRVDNAALLLSLPGGLRADANDLGGQFHRNLTSLRVPRICVKFLLRSLAEHRRWLEVCELESDAYLDMYSSPIGWRKKAADQTAFIEEQDLPTGRAKRMFGGLGSHQSRYSHSNGVFLPQPDLSDRRRYRSMTTARPPVQRVENRSSWQRPHLSESDSGEDILDTDRDARLAKTRTETPIPRHSTDKDEAMNEGDESDTEDLSEGTSSDDNWSDLDTAEFGSTAPALKQYSRLCKQYVAPHLDSPFMWEGSPFSLLRSRREPSSSSNFETPDYTVPPPSSLDVEPREDCKTSVLRFSCRKALEVTITPLVVTVITNLEADLEKNILSPELSVDSILAGYLGSFGQSEKSSKTTVFDIRLSSVNVHVLHEVKLAENDNARGLHKDADPLSAPTDIARLRCHLDDVHVIGTTKQDGTAVHGRFAQVVLAVNPNITGCPEPTENPVFRLAILASTLSMSKDNPAAVLSGISLQLSQQSLEYTTALGIGLSHTMQQLLAVKQKRERRNSTVTADVSGTPHTLRTDTIFRFLFHLRHCLWELGDISALPKPDMGLIPLLESRLATLDPDVFHDDHLSPLYPLFPTLDEHANREPTSTSYPAMSVSLELHRFTVLLRDVSGGVAGEFVLTDLVSNLRLRTSDFIETLPGHQAMGISQFGVSLQVMHGTWLSWRVQNIITYLNSLGALKQTFGLRLASQIFSITAKSNTQDVTASTKLKVVFPSLSLCGDYNGSHIQTIALVDFLEFKVKPVHWDTLLAVQQKFGQDFNDLVVLVQETRSSAPAPKPSHVGTRWKYVGFLKMRGFRIGLEGLSSTFYLECFDISGSIDNLSRRLWSLKLTDLALSLAPKAAVEPGNSVFNRHRRSAFVIIDFEVKGEDGTEEVVNSVLQIAVTKIHAVMQASSIGEVGDFVDHLQAELRDRKGQRAVELAAFKEKAQSILKTFEVPVEDVQAKEQSFWLQSYVIKLSVDNIGVAFPLTHDHNLEIPQTGSRDSTAVRAFLFSIKSIKFGTQRGESGEAKMQGLSFQFVSRFRQSVATDFAGDTHQTRNRLIYPEMTAHLRSVGLVSSRNIWMRANVSGFILDIDSTIPEYIFSLIDVYEQGKDRVSRLSASIPRNAASSTSTESEQYTTLPTSNVFASFTFLSGKVRFYSKAASALSTSSLSNVLNQPSDEQMLDMGADVFNLPVVSVWAEYRATSASHKAGVLDSEPSILVFKTTIHSSQNTLRPSTLLPFLAELVGQVEALMRRASRTTGPDSEAPVTSVSLPITSETEVSETQVKRTESATPQNFQIIFSLRIDQSKLEFTCQPDVNVIAGLHWDSGGFVLHFFPGARKVTLTGSIGGLNVGLKHGFLSEECAKLDMRNLAFSVTFAKTGYGTGRAISSVSFVLDTEILGAVRLSRLQDILCFKAVWLDRIPVFNHMSSEVKATNKATSTPASTALPAQEFTTVLLIRIHQISLEVDLGQSISTITLDLKDTIARTKLTEELSEVSLYVTDVAIVAKGNLSGHSTVSNCVFQTIRRVQNSSPVEGNRMLELRMTSDAVVVVLESDHQKLLHYRAEPLEVEIYDDWSIISPDVEQADRTVRFSVTVESPEIVAVVTVGTIPKLLSYGHKFKANLDAQRDGASRESKTFHLSRSPNPDNPLSAVAEAMLHSARSKFKEADSELSYTIRQHMSLRLGTLRLIVFPRTMGDLEIAQFIGRDVGAQLERLIEMGGASPKRDLQLSFSFMTISRFTQLGHLAPPTILLSDGREWLTSLLKNAAEANILGLPSMRIHMVSEEALEGTAKVLKYNFNSRFNREQSTRSFEDIYISLNVSLYSWLTLLRKNLSREMDQARATAEWRSSVAAAPPVVRRKAPESSQTDPAKTARVPVKSGTADHQTTKPEKEDDVPASTAGSVAERGGVIYRHQKRYIERLTMRQLGEATPDVMHPFFMKKAGFNLEDSLPQYVNEYATRPLEEIMDVLLKLYSRQLLAGNR
ncbi:hypothetical protein K438DRAFT_1959629 [Mycena galopus ATCC 62051]|nr:hypothetical protein K438DRAFT_1959629 [Mycena galopus ATCC 62051]